MQDDTRPKDTIRDAFEAMLAFFQMLINRKFSGAYSAAVRIGAEASEDFDLTHWHAQAATLALRDLIQRAAEEHAKIEGCDVCGRTPTTSGSEDGEQRHVCAEHGPDTWTPARIAEALERCERAPEGPWGVFEQDCLCWITGPTRIIGDEGEMSRTVATFIAAARTGYPSALRALQAAQGEIERLTNANANHKALRAAAETAGRAVCDERDKLREAAQTCEWQHKPCPDCGAMRNFIGQGLYECWKCTALEQKAEIERLTGRVEDVVLRSAEVATERDNAKRRTEHVHDAANKLYQAAQRVCDDYVRGEDGETSAIRTLRAALDHAEAEACAKETARRDGLEAEIERLKALRAPSSSPVDAADMAAITASHERAKQAPAVAGKRSAS